MIVVVYRQVVQETSSKSYHRQLKHTIAAKLEALPRNQSATHERLAHIVPLAIGLPLAPWPQDGERVADLLPEQQRQVSDMKTHTSESGIRELDYVRESSYDADISAPTSPLHPPNYGDNFCKASFAERRPVGGLVLQVGDNRCSWQDINIDDSPNEEILPNGEGVPHLATNAVLDVELNMSEHHAMLDHIVPETTRPGNEGDCVEFISSDSYYVGCHGPIRETIL
ncbi:hypothetical protein LSAT2_026038 [Lamellibrachia satsuma]|nr:hypothetical protein LSAT2_026038 [Lamellibrachia satsuma]